MIKYFEVKYRYNTSIFETKYKYDWHEKLQRQTEEQYKIYVCSDWLLCIKTF